MSEGVLGSILAATRRRIREGGYSPAQPAGSSPDGARFLSSLREPGTRILAEIKARSPSSGEILKNCDRKVETLALTYRRGHAAAISVVTERESFGGDPRWIERAKRISGLPVIMKDFVLEEMQLDFAASHGADAVLLLAAVVDDRLDFLIRAAELRGMAVLVETRSGEEIQRAAAAGAPAIGVNARDLRTFAVRLEDLVSLAPSIPPGCVRVAESGIGSRRDVETLAAAGYEAFLVGEALLRSEEPEVLLRELRGDA
ncbi:MAG: indole-3-glycerol phosphate synthase TrpC [Thermoanaerobaculia bacterium]